MMHAAIASPTAEQAGHRDRDKPVQTGVVACSRQQPMTTGLSYTGWAKIKSHHHSLLLVTMACICNIQWFLTHVNYIMQQVDGDYYCSLPYTTAKCSRYKWTLHASTLCMPPSAPLMPSSHCQHRQDKTALSCPYQRCELNSRQNKTVFSSPQYIWDWTVANWKLGQDKTKLSSHCTLRQDKPVLTCHQFSSHSQTRQDSFVLSMSVVWNRHYSASPHNVWNTINYLQCENVAFVELDIWPATAGFKSGGLRHLGAVQDWV